MSDILPKIAPTGGSLADVLVSALKSCQGRSNVLDLNTVNSAIVLLVDGLGAYNLRSAAGHARFLNTLMTKRDVIRTCFPSTTAAALATLATGTLPGEHGLVGYTALEPDRAKVFNQLSHWGPKMLGNSWQRAQTVFEKAVQLGISAYVIVDQDHLSTGFTTAVFRGATVFAEQTLALKLKLAQTIAESEVALIYVYEGVIDRLGHKFGWESAPWLSALEQLDYDLSSITSGPQKLNLKNKNGRTTGLLVTADHGMVDIPQHKQVLIGTQGSLLAGVFQIAGEPRWLSLHFAPELSTVDQLTLRNRWYAAERERAWVFTKSEGIAAGIWGTVGLEVERRLGDLNVVARAGVAYYDERVTNRGRVMIGQHGGMTDEETRIPLLRLGAYARS